MHPSVQVSDTGRTVHIHVDRQTAGELAVLLNKGRQLTARVSALMGEMDRKLTESAVPPQSNGGDSI